MKILSHVALIALSCVATASFAADVPLYETGPSEDSSFLRFVNATPQTLDITAAGSKGKTTLPVDKPTTQYFPIKAKSGINGTLSGGGSQAPVNVTVEPGEFATVFALPSANNALTARVIREQPDDFNATKVSLAFYSVDDACKDASVQVAGRSVMLFEKLAAGEIKRRSINPITLSVQLLCSGTATGEPLPLGALQAGQRYSLFAVPGTGRTRIVLASDALAN